MNQSRDSVETQLPATYREQLAHLSPQVEPSECQVKQQQNEGVTNLLSVSRPMEDVAKPDQGEQHSTQSSISDREPLKNASRDIKEDLFSLFTNNTDTVVIDSVTIPIVEEPLYMHPDAAWKCLSHKGQAFTDKNGNIVALEDLGFHQQVAWLSMMTRGQLWTPNSAQQTTTEGKAVAENDECGEVVRESPVWQKQQALIRNARDGPISLTREVLPKDKRRDSGSAVRGPVRKGLTDSLTSAAPSTNGVQPLQFALQSSTALMMPKALVIPKTLPISGKKVYRIEYRSTRAQVNRFNNRRSLATLVLESLLSQVRAVLVKDTSIAGGESARFHPVETVVGSVCCPKVHADPAVGRELPSVLEGQEQEQDLAGGA
ncbi:hypothetical protein KC343_g14875 [Hortaea werneckii]|nr:hypothetical protein KC338_g5731 [Hortaea werneckii]KAI6866025.1 hypothetical protein KC323_g4113 [Hortaea werneckii]KAI7160555.1 hypothetical protein KC352_g26950 [Hortaea werneckii]KAI7349916.1 hypothetical protein KC320_g5783 [Hortaea werneckii]KAI7548273.1 hypothetical protein KC317_g14900 [Hortaea werneckii]